MKDVGKQQGSGKGCQPVPNLDRELWALCHGYQAIAGIDETGRGPLAGPVVVSAVILGQHWNPKHRLADSKQLKPEQREELYYKIIREATAVRTISVPASCVDRINVLQASLLGMKLAVEQLLPKADYVLVDGNHFPELNLPGEAIVHGDGKCASIAAASIVAKVTRDRIMEGMQFLYTGWNFGRHKGYPTRDHRQILKIRGPSPIHRKSFIVRKT